MSKGEGVKPSRIDPKFRYEVAKMLGGRDVLQCFQCGTCTSDCPVSRFSEKYRPRYIIRMVQLGLKERVLNSDFLWLCASCFTCTDRCPQGVEVANVIRTLKNMTAMEGRIPEVFKVILGNLVKTGYIYRIPDSRIKRREELGLPPLSKVNIEGLNKSLQNIGIGEILKEVLQKGGEVDMWV
ncbi:MAG: 4Fe-4S dicluster domain-containing protein [Candidatus Bathyarchaeota archaeon]|nr:4Fe-4S dicluster domain-containing protein [Candidatus Bathyarchaeota archaeon]